MIIRNISGGPLSFGGFQQDLRRSGFDSQEQHKIETLAPAEDREISDKLREHPIIQNLIDGGKISIISFDSAPDSVVTQEELDAVAGAAVTDLLGLSDTPSAYTGEAGKVLAVKGAEDGTEFIVPAAGSPLDDILELTDPAPTGTADVVTRKDAGANAPLLLSGKGTGGIQIHQTTGDATGGNARGSYAVDLQVSRGTAPTVVTAAADQVASGTHSFVHGAYNTASGNYSHAQGWGTLASGKYSHSEGVYTRATNTGAHAEGQSSIAGGRYSHAQGAYCETTQDYAFALGLQAKAVHAAGMTLGGIGFSSPSSGIRGEVQTTWLVGRGSTVGASTSFIHYQGGTDLPITDNSTNLIDVFIVARSTAPVGNHAMFHRRAMVEKTSGTSALTGEQTIGVDAAIGWSVDLDLVTNNLRVEITGNTPGETIRWVAMTRVVEVTE